jgi:hypothetical protein
VSEEHLEEATPAGEQPAGEQPGAEPAAAEEQPAAAEDPLVALK